MGCAVVATVTQIKGNRLGTTSAWLGSQQARNDAFIARRSGVSAGTFASVGEARTAIDKAFGHRLHWVRNDLPSNVQHWEATDPKVICPTDIWGDDLITWNELTVLPQPTFTTLPVIGGARYDAETKLVQLFGDRSGQGNGWFQATSSKQPVAVGLDGSPSLQFDPAGDFMGGESAAPLAGQRFYITVYANYTGPVAADRNVIKILGSANIFTFGADSAAGTWKAAVNGSSVAGGVANASAKVVSVRQSDTQLGLRVEGAVVDTAATPTPASADQAASLSSEDAPWGGSIWMVVIAKGTGEPDARQAQTERYALQRFRSA